VKLKGEGNKLSDAYQENLRNIEAAEKNGKRFCPQCGSRMKTCCEVYRQFKLGGHKPNGVHEGPEEWVCINCGTREYKELVLRVMCGRAGTL
jgi:ribosomal protein S27AE